MWNHLRLGFAKYFFAVLALLASIQAAATPKNCECVKNGCVYIVALFGAFLVTCVCHCCVLL